MKVPSSAPPPRQWEGQNVDAHRGVRRRDEVDPTVREAAEGMEAMFLDTMIQAMRGTVEESEFSLENPATKIYRGMLDSEIAKQTARTNSIGLADQIIAYLEQRGYNQREASDSGRAKPVADSRQK